MNRPRAFLEAPKRPPAFLLGGWVMLLVVLLCSAPMGGPPRTRVIGSAFDPATTSVAVSPKQPKIAAATAKKSPRRDPSTARLVDVALGAAAIGPVLDVGYEPQATHALALSHSGTPAPQRLLTRPLGTRAPPRA